MLMVLIDEMEAHEEATAIDIMELLQEHGADWADPDSVVLDGNAVEFTKYTGRVYRLTVAEC